MSVLDDVKKLLSGQTDEQLEVINRRTTERVVSLIGLESDNEKYKEVIAAVDTIIYEVSLKRFNRIGNEGMQSYSQEGLSISFPDSDFDEYKDEISRWRKKLSDDQKGAFATVFLL
ncbi:phage head-tail connector protein [Vagococcus salmoninarum]|uniref:phage head-tail connector protein n=1 Tax=Vagococcus salmoninarum TaxID=2739 RepID=UPI0028D578A3|nr:phage head-tail connector protein [Vagococcus salmoninarum]